MILAKNDDKENCRLVLPPLSVQNVLWWPKHKLYWKSADGQVGVLNVTDFTKDEFNLIPIDLTVNGIRTDNNKFFMPVLEICPIKIRVGVDDVNMTICDDHYSNLIWYGKILTPIVVGTNHTFYVKLLNDGFT